MTKSPSVSSRGRAASRPAAPADPVSVVVAAAVSATLVVMIGIALALITVVGSWALAPHTDDVGPETAARVAVGLWLYAHHSPLELSSVPLSIVPLGLLLLPLGLAYAGGRQVARVTRPQSLHDVTRAVIPYALVYGLLAAIVAGLVGSDEVRPATRAAFFGATLIALVGGGVGLLRASGLMADAVTRVPRVARDIGAAAGAALGTMLVVSAVLTALLLAVGFPDAVETFRALDAGWVGAPLLVLLTVAFVPNLVLWSASFATGVGFPLGAAGAVSPQGVEYGPLPVFPPLAALPPEGEPGLWAFIVLIAPLLAGCAAGAVVVRRRSGPPGVDRDAQPPVEQLAVHAAAGGALAGLLLGALAGLSAGAAGDGALVTLGPVGWQVGLVAGLEMALVAAVAAWELSRRAGSGGRRLIDLRDRVVLPSGVSRQVKAVLRRR